MKTKLTTSKIATIVLLSIVVVFILFIYSAINGIPFGGMYAKYKLKNYVKQVYNISIVSKAMYNVKNSNYYITVDNNPNFELVYSLYDNTINDGRVYRAFNEQLVKEYKVIKDKYDMEIELPISLDLVTEIKANGKYSRDFFKLTYTQKLTFQSYPGIVNHYKIPVATRIKQPSVITSDIISKLGSKFNITSINAKYTDSNGLLILDYTGLTKPTIQQLQADTTKVYTASNSNTAELVKLLKSKKSITNEFYAERMYNRELAKMKKHKDPLVKLLNKWDAYHVARLMVDDINNSVESDEAFFKRIVTTYLKKENRL